MITKLRVRNFKNLADVQAEFGPLNVIVGPNGCGKSSLLQAIDFLRAFFHPSIEDYLREIGFDYSDLPNLRRRGKVIQWELTAELGPDDSGECGGTYEYTVRVIKRRYLGIGQEILRHTPAGGEPRVLIERSGRKVKTFAGASVSGTVAVNTPRSLMVDAEDGRNPRNACPEMFRFREWVMSFRSFLLWDPKVLRRPDRGRHLELGASGEHLAPVLANLRRRFPDRFGRIVESLKRLVPTLTDIKIKGGKGWGWQQIALVEGREEKVSFNSQQASDGVLRLLAVLALLHGESLPGVLTFEEPENGMHPQLVSEVVQMLREITQRKTLNGCQVFLTTHSPYVLDEFLHHPEQVYVMERGKPLEGAKLFRLSERRDIKLIQNTFDKSLGEAWFSGLIGGASGRK